MVSFILSYREVDIYRRRNLLFTIKNILSLNFEKEIIVVEEGLINHISDIPNIKPIFFYSNKLFNKSKCYNEGVKVAKYDILCFRDIDIFIEDKLYIKAIELLKTYDVVDPYYIVRYLSNEDTELYISTKKYNYPIKSLNSGVISGGMFFQNKKKFLKFDENCVGYGFEDDLYDIKLYRNKQKVCKIMNGVSYHLWHPVRENVQNNNMNLYRKENIILWKLKWITELNY